MADTDATEVRMTMEIAQTLHGEPTRDEFLLSVFPVFLGLVGGDSGGYRSFGADSLILDAFNAKLDQHVD